MKNAINRKVMSIIGVRSPSSIFVLAFFNFHGSSGLADRFELVKVAAPRANAPQFRWSLFLADVLETPHQALTGDADFQGKSLDPIPQNVVGGNRRNRNCESQQGRQQGRRDAFGQTIRVWCTAAEQQCNGRN